MKNRQFIILFLSVVNVMIGYGLVIPFVSIYQNHFNISILMTGLLISFYALGQFIFAPISGDFITRYGERKVLVISQILLGICIIAVFAIHVFWVMLIFRFLCGMCAACIYSSSEHFIATKSKESLKTRLIMLLSVASGVGMIIGPLLGIFIIEFVAVKNMLTTSQILNVTSLLACVFMLYIFVISIFAYVILPTSKGRDIEIEKVNILTFFPNLLKQIFIQCKNVTMLFILCGFFLYGYITSSVEAYFLDFVMKNYSTDKLLLIIEMAIIMLILAIFFIKIAPLLERKLKNITLLIVYLLIPCFSFLVLAFIPPLGVFFPMFVIIMASTAVFSSLLVAFISSESKTPGVVLGVKNSIISIGMIMGPIISGYFYDKSPNNFMLQICVALLFVALFGFFVRHKYYRKV